MGWTATDDPTAQLRLKFSSLSAAIDYAEREGLDYDLVEPPARRPITKSYRETIAESCPAPGSRTRAVASMSGDRLRPRQAHELEVNHGLRISHPVEGEISSTGPTRRLL
jgi:hypothetical protein